MVYIVLTRAFGTRLNQQAAAKKLARLVVDLGQHKAGAAISKCAIGGSVIGPVTSVNAQVATAFFERCGFKASFVDGMAEALELVGAASIEHIDGNAASKTARACGAAA